MTEGGRPTARWLLPLVGFTLFQLVYARLIPPLGGPDEEDHCEYVASLNRHARLPVLPSLPSKRFEREANRWETVAIPVMVTGPKARQAQHPPLAHLVYALWERALAPFGWSDGGLRLAGLLWGVLTLLGLVRLGEDLFEDQPLVRDGLPLLVLLPGPIYLCAVVSNDGAAMAAGVLVTWRLFRLTRYPPTPREIAWLGLALGLGLLVKATLLVFLPFALLALFLALRRERTAASAGLHRLAIFLALALGPLVPWLVRNHSLYGLWLPRADLRPMLYAWSDLSSHPDAAYFIGIQVLQAGLFWPAMVPAPLWLLLPHYSFYITLVLLVWVAILIAAMGLRTWRRTSPPPHQVRCVWLSVQLVVAMVVLYLQQFLFQDFLVALFGGRYFLPLLGAAGSWLLLGFSDLVAPENRRRPLLCLLTLILLLAAAVAPLVANPPRSP